MLEVYDVKLFVITTFNGFFKLFYFFDVGLVLEKGLLQSPVLYDQGLLSLGLLTNNFEMPFYLTKI